ncbi:MAG: hypothetical protein F4X56_01110 [Gammaproteobacteria bacterium]|nr:hypothetical protein [Gammaproteobacteria bacterium]
MTDTNKLQDQLFRGIDARLERDLEEGDVAYFNALMLKLEYLTKIVVLGVVSCIDDDTDGHRYSLEHKLVRSQSLVDWVEILNTALVGTPAQFLSSSARKVTRELTERKGHSAWWFDALLDLRESARLLGTHAGLGEKVPLRRFFEIGAQIRNRTRGHGATITTECHAACPHLEQAIDAVIENMELLKLPWVYLHQNLSGKYRVSALLGNTVSLDYLKRTTNFRLQSGVYVQLEAQSDPSKLRYVPLIYTTPEIHDIALPNGNFEKGKFETLSYVTNTVGKESGARWSRPGTNLPGSETDGVETLEPVGGIFTNIPSLQSGYVPRPNLEHRVLTELATTERHPIVTLTGPGGIGKTSVALRAINQISQHDKPPYEVVLWISARDIDLLDDGPKPVSRNVFSQRDIARATVRLLNPAERNETDFDPITYFQDCLKEGTAGTTLFVLDNFETLQNPIEVYEWLDAHIRLPNKVLITTRFRDFRGDYPIQITGMLDDEADKLIDQHAKRLGISQLISGRFKSELISESEGHPYVIKILLGQSAKENRAVKPSRIVATADRLLDALFKRTFEALSSAAQRVFLLLCSWRMYVPEVAVQAVALRPEVERYDVAAALDEAIQYSLIDQTTSSKEDTRFVGVPLAAAIFGQRELQVSRFKAAVEEDRKLLMGFGAGKRDSVNKGALPRINNLINGISKRVRNDPNEWERLKPILEYLANCHPKTYLRLVDLVLDPRGKQRSPADAERYLKAYLETADMAEKEQAWDRLLDLYAELHDTVGEVHALCEIALLPTSNFVKVSNVANQLNSRIRDLKDQRIEDAWSYEVKELLQEVINVLERSIDKLSATDCSRLAWLHLNVGNRERARDVAKIGLKHQSDNEHCHRIIKYLES